jgi:hypothetical protein
MPSEFSLMDPLSAFRSSLPARPTDLPASRDLDPAPVSAFASDLGFAAELVAALDSSTGSSPEEQQQAVLHLLSHVDAACFISLLQTLDPKPHDQQRLAEYRRYYRNLESVMTLPAPARDA